MSRQEWTDDAACRYVGSHLFFSTHDPEDGMRPPGGQEQVRVKQARSVCAECPVWRQCRFVGLAEADGVWGGMSTRERREARAIGGLASFGGGEHDNERLIHEMYDDLDRAGGDVDTVLIKYPRIATLFVDIDERLVRPFREGGETDQ